MFLKGCKKLFKNIKIYVRNQSEKMRFLAHFDFKHKITLI